MCGAHLRELVDRYEPDVLWNDIAMPAAVDLDSLFTHHYGAVLPSSNGSACTQHRGHESIGYITPDNNLTRASCDCD